MKNRAGLLALIVLAIASLLMIFVVMPFLKGDRKPVDDIAKVAADATKVATDTVSEAGKAATDAVADVAKQVSGDTPAVVLEKMARLKADASAATEELKGLFADGKVPTAEALAATKARAETALKALADFKLPEGMDAVTTELAAKLSQGSAKVLAMVQALPADAAAAKTAVDGFGASLADLLDGKVADATAAPADAAKPADQAAAAADEAVPSFDVVRVEKDGSTVIAGRAEPDSKLEVVNGDDVIVAANVDGGGEFVAVLDNPLKPGDYQLTLRTTDKDGKATDSAEVATISVPKDAAGQLLAMVTKPGEASRIITAPAGAVSTEVADAAKPADATAADASKPADTATADAAKPADAAATEIKTPDLPAASGDLANTAPVVATGDAAATPAATDTAASDAAPKDATKPAAAAALAQVGAVEIEGDKLFVAGKASQGATLKVYADDMLLSQIKADEAGNFVADGTMPLTVGNHTISVEVVDAAGAVTFKASVPFNRPEGDQVAAVADATGSAIETVAAGKSNRVTDGAFSQLHEEANKAIGLLKGLYADGKVPTAEQLAAARSATEIALKSLTDFKPADDADAATREAAAKVSAGAASALAMLKAVPQDPAAVGAALAGLDKAVGDALAPAAILETTRLASAKVAAGTPAADYMMSLNALEAKANDQMAAFKALLADGSAATPEQIAAVRAALETSLGDIKAFAAKPIGNPEASGKVATLSSMADATLAALAKLPATADKAAYAAAMPAVGGSAADTATAETAASGTASEPAKPAEKADAVALPDAAKTGEQTTADATAADTGAAPKDEAKTVEQAPLKESKTSVIIRRGDTLWQISRRVYGKGIRYTTIYLANQDQIQDPNKIAPGQVFGVPDKAQPDTEAEAIHREELKKH